MVLSATFNNISAISWRSDLSVKETGVTGENRRPAESHWHNVVSSFTYTSQWAGLEVTMLVVIYTDCISSCKSNYHRITTTTVPNKICFFFQTFNILTNNSTKTGIVFLYNVDWNRMPQPKVISPGEDPGGAPSAPPPPPPPPKIGEKNMILFA